jgi:hypothetical protein
VRKRSPRVIRLMRPLDSCGVGVFAIIDRKTAFYAFKEIPCEIGGRGFALHRLGLGDLYHVCISSPAESSCECLGFLRHGHCKHVQGLSALIGHAMI